MLHALPDFQPDEIESLAATFRRAIEECDPRDLPIALQHFPRGACDDASLLLAEYLFRQGLPRAQRISGNRGQQTHVWLELGGMTIDITADQFDDYPGTRFVLSEATWHAQFYPVKSRPADIASTLRRAYEVIAARLPANE